MPEEAVSQFLNRITQTSAVHLAAEYGFALKYLEMSEGELEKVVYRLHSSAGLAARDTEFPCTGRPNVSSDKGATNRVMALRKILERVTSTD
jgi:hypothetical protein